MLIDLVRAIPAIWNASDPCRHEAISSTTKGPEMLNVVTLLAFTRLQSGQALVLTRLFSLLALDRSL